MVLADGAEPLSFRQRERINGSCPEKTIDTPHRDEFRLGLVPPGAIADYKKRKIALIRVFESGGFRPAS